MAPSDEDFTSKPSRRPDRDRDRDRYREDRDDDYDDRPRRRRRYYGDNTQTSGMATASLILGLLSIFLCVLTGLPALILGICALVSIKKSEGRLAGAGLAWFGIVLGGLNLVALVGMIPATMRVRESAKLMQSSNNLKEMGLAMHSHNDYTNSLPPAVSATKEGKPGLSWRVWLLPYIEQDNLFRQFHLDEPWDSPHNIKLLDKMPRTYRSPKDPEGTTDTPYRVFVGKDLIFSAEPYTRGGQRPRYSNIMSIPDGSSNTILVVEAATKVPWTKPDELEYADDKPLPELGYLRDDSFMVLMADGSVRTIYKRNLKEANFRNMIKPNDGNVVNFD